MTSETYADLGGGVGSDFRPAAAGHRHRFDPLSGWCGCGTRDDGTLADYSPAWLAARREHAL
ncbi:hypothetical protein P2P98_14055 [Microbacterium sp. Kw_RZR3]|uniref:hypothetical protein n=1 Tax=Microbacterium sp. Kw_RZR3 TaxID=3032903 RepID=UPI0023DAD5CE|nr:hypothetical protein [Microbacterium sp. Kw_RZR3]MDF2047286.1 hypothetical protein [Microbacterium sp. Kw_RZR3]